MPISGERCQMCRFNDPRLTAEQTAELMVHVPGWEIVINNDVEHLVKSFPFENWESAMEFAGRIGEQATFEDHHPILTIRWGRVTVDWWTHVISGLHRNDFIMACRTDHMYEEFAPGSRSSGLR